MDRDRLRAARHLLLNIGLNAVNALSAYLLGFVGSLIILLGYDGAYFASHGITFIVWSILYPILSMSWPSFLLKIPHLHLLVIAASLIVLLCIQRLTRIPFKRAIAISFLLIGIGTTLPIAFYCAVVEY